MAGKSYDFETNWLYMFFQGTTVGATGLFVSGVATSYWVSLHTSGTLSSGAQTTQEAAYTGYTRVSVARTSGAWSLVSTANPPTVAPIAAITFPVSTSSGLDITHFGIGSASAGTGKLYYWGTVTPNITINGAGVTPSLTTASTGSET